MNPDLNILIVEDNELDVEKIERALRKLNIRNRIFKAENGLEALELLRGTKSVDKVPLPRVILLDLNMPKMNGIECLKEIRADKELNDTHVLVLTTSDDETDIQRTHQYNISGYIVKPLDSQKMREAFSVISSYWSLCKHPQKKLADY